MLTKTENSLTLKESLFFHCYPGGNDTYIGVGLDNDRTSYPDWNNLMLSKNPILEQGGFIEATNNPKMVGRFQMAGGEFCGNGARSFIALIANDFVNKKNLSKYLNFDAIRKEGEYLLIQFECSGCEKPLLGKVRIQPNEPSNYWVELEIPAGDDSIIIRTVSFYVDERKIQGYVVTLPGITHIVAHKPALKEYDKKTLLYELINDFELHNELAVGLIFIEEKNTTTRMEVAVFVTATNTMCEETSCSSGTLALGIVKMFEAGSMELKSTILQPSGSSIDVDLTGKWKDNLFSLEACSLAGEVSIIKKLETLTNT